MRDGKKDMEEYLNLRDAAAEIDVTPDYLRLRIHQGILEAEKFGGRDWWVQRSKLYEFDENRRPRGPVPVETGDQKLDEKREYYREAQQRRRAKIKKRAG